MRRLILVSGLAGVLLTWPLIAEPELLVTLSGDSGLVSIRGLPQQEHAVLVLGGVDRTLSFPFSTDELSFTLEQAGTLKLSATLKRGWLPVTRLAGTGREIVIRRSSWHIGITAGHGGLPPSVQSP